MPERDSAGTDNSWYTELDEDATRSNSNPTTLDRDSFDQMYRLITDWSRSVQISWNGARGSRNESSGRLSASDRVERINALCVHYGLTPGLYAHLTRERYSWKLNGHRAGEWAYVPCLASETNSVSGALDIIERRIGGTP